MPIMGHILTGRPTCESRAKRPMHSIGRPPGEAVSASHRLPTSGWAITHLQPVSGLLLKLLLNCVPQTVQPSCAQPHGTPLVSMGRNMIVGDGGVRHCARKEPDPKCHARKSLSGQAAAPGSKHACPCRAAS